MAKVRKRTWMAADGPKTAWIADYKDQAGKRHIKTFQSRKAADAWLVEARHEVTQGIHTPAGSSVTVAHAGEDWIAQGEADGLERSTIEQYRQHLDYHIKPFIGAVRLAELTPAMVPNLHNRLLREGRSRTMTKKAISSLGAILANALASGRVGRNVVRDQERQRRRQHRLDKRHTKRLEIGVDIPTKDEIRRMLAVAEGKMRALLTTAIFTGLRASELRGLRWADIDFNLAELTVRQRADRWGKIGSPKSDTAKRTIPLAPLAVNGLREWRLACPKSDLDLVFPNGKGRPQQLTAIHYRGLGPLQLSADIEPESALDMVGKPKTRQVKRRGKPLRGEDDKPFMAPVLRPKYGLHSFRHAAASLFIEEGFTPKRVQALMGHSTIQMTFDTYGHLFPAPADDQAAMRRLQARLIG